MNWKIILGAAVLLLVIGVGVGFVDGGSAPSAESARQSAYLTLLGIGAVLYSAVFLWIGFVQRNRTWLHALLAVAVSELLAYGILEILSRAMHDPVEGGGWLLAAVHWATVAAGLIAGVSVGQLAARKRRSNTRGGA